MLPKLTKLRPAQTRSTMCHSRHDTISILGRAVMIKHNCPCCSDTLLRHMRFEGLYWRCSSCYQEMPI